MNVIFLDKALEELSRKGTTTNKKYKKLCRNKKLIEGFIQTVKIMIKVERTEELRKYSFLHYERLKNDKRSSIRIKNGSIERLLFYETKNGIEVELIEIDDTHYGKK